MQDERSLQRRPQLARLLVAAFLLKGHVATAQVDFSSLNNWRGKCAQSDNQAPGCGSTQTVTTDADSSARQAAERSRQDAARKAAAANARIAELKAKISEIENITRNGSTPPPTGYRWRSDVPQEAPRLNFKSRPTGDPIVNSDEFRSTPSTRLRFRGQEVTPPVDVAIVRATPSPSLIESAVEFREQIEVLKRLSGADYREHIEVALKSLATSWLIRVPAVADEVQRRVMVDYAKEQVTKEMKSTLHQVVSRIAIDIQKLTPFVWNPFRAAEREKLLALHAQVLVLEHQAAAELEGPRTFSEVQSGPRIAVLKYLPGPAIEQLNSISNSRKWRD